MKSKEYLIEKISRIAEIFSHLSFRYQYDIIDQTHIVEVKPLEDFNSNEDYATYEADLTFSFDQKFFPESVMFVSEDSLTKVTNPEFEIIPCKISLNLDFGLEQFKFDGFDQLTVPCCNFEYRLAA
ncbi:MAG: hypothetical protein M0P58_09675 [Bacteroidales bacterium]|nr:hypothetical protein [Bacteroidales bacterium]